MQIFPLRWGRVPARAGEGYPARKKLPIPPKKLLSYHSNMKIINFKTLPSTNKWALEHINELEDKTIIIAGTQTAGHGRFQRSWNSDNPENLYLTFVLKPEKPEHISNLTQYLSLTLVKVLKENYKIHANIKWPNDVRVNKAKIAGILCESVIKGKKPSLALGIGVNLNMNEEELAQIPQKAASLNLLTGKNIDKNEFANRLCEEFFKNYEKFLEKGFPSIKTEYEQNAEFLNKKITVTTPAEKAEYTAIALTEKGTLIVQAKNGEKKELLSGDVEL